MLAATAMLAGFGRFAQRVQPTPDNPFPADSESTSFSVPASGLSDSPKTPGAARTRGDWRRVRAQVWWLAPAIVVMVIGWAVRWWLTQRHAIPAGMDAAYYPYQVNFLLDHGRLAYSDMPLFFWLAAGVTRVLDIFGYTREAGALLASQLIDSGGQPVAALGVGALLARWCAGEQHNITITPGAQPDRGTSGGGWSGIMLVAGVASAAVLHASPIRMVGDFEKNALALVWFVGAVWAALGVARAADSYVSLRNITVRPCTMWLVIFTGLTGLTHIGTMGVLLLTLAIGFVVWSIVSIRSRAGFVAAAWGLAMCAAAAGWCGVYALDSHRAMNLLRAPTKLLGSSGPAAGEQIRNSTSEDVTALKPVAPQGAGSSARGGMGMRKGGPPRDGGGAFTYVVAGASLAAIIILRRRARPGEVALVAGCAGGALLCVAPLWSGDYAMRLSLIAPLPGVLALAGACGCVWAYVRDHEKRLLSLERANRLRAICAGVALCTGVAAVASGVHTAVRGGHVVVSQAEVAELRELGTLVGARPPLMTLVVARHGLEWWAGYILKVPVRLNEIPQDALEKYRRVYVLVSAPSVGRVEEAIEVPRWDLQPPRGRDGGGSGQGSGA
jgi:hypothetical protein